MTERAVGQTLAPSMRVLGWCLAPGAWMLALQLAWEATFLTADKAPQMVGFSFLHTSSLALPVVASAFLAQAWLVFVFLWGAYVAFRGHRIARPVWIQFGSLAVPIGILFGTPGISG